MFTLGYCLDEPDPKPGRSYSSHRNNWNNHTLGQVITYNCNKGYVFTDNRTHYSNDNATFFSGIIPRDCFEQPALSSYLNLTTKLVLLDVHLCSVPRGLQTPEGHLLKKTHEMLIAENAPSYSRTIECAPDSEGGGAWVGDWIIPNKCWGKCFQIFIR